MRLLIIGLLSVATMLVAAERTAKTGFMVTYDTDAVIEFADEDLVGSSNNITIDTESYLFEPVGLAREQFQQLQENHEFHTTGKTVPGTVVGFIVEETGHFPNPTAKFKVFKALSLSFPLLRTLDRRPARDIPAKSVRLTLDSDAVIHFAQEEMAGSYDHIVIDSKSYIIDPTAIVREHYTEYIKGNHSFHKVDKTAPGAVLGFIVKEKGHFPNPMAEFEVFKALSLEFSVPRSATPGVPRDVPSKSVLLTYSNKAVINFAKEQMPGSYDNIDINKVNFVFEALQPMTETFETLKGNYERYKQDGTRPGTAVGVVVKEKGHMPNPTVEFDVFKALALNFPLLRSLPPRPESDEDGAR